MTNPDPRPHGDYRDPRQNAPARLSDLHGDERRRALLDRHERQLDRYMQDHVYNRRAPGLFSRLLKGGL